MSELAIINGDLVFNGSTIVAGLDLTLDPFTLAALKDHIESRPKRGIFYSGKLTAVTEYYISKRASGFCLYKRVGLDKSDLVTPVYIRTETGNYRNAFETKGEAQVALDAFREHCAANPKSSMPIPAPYRGARRA